MYTPINVIHDDAKDVNVTLEDLNEELFQLHIPAFIFIIIAMLTGIVGNVFVLLIYKAKFKRSNHRYFILFLAAIDLCACLVGMPYLVASLRLPYLMTSSPICKTVRYCHYLFNNSSGLLLLLISVERYRKICHPMRPQLTSTQILYLCYGVLIFSAVVAIPAPIFFGKSTIHTGIANLTGTQCYVEDAMRGKAFFEYYMGFLMAETVICIAAFVILYAFIIRRLMKSDMFLEAMRSMKMNSAGQTDHEASFSTDAIDDDGRDTSNNDENSECCQPLKQADSSNAIDSKNGSSNSIIKDGSSTISRRGFEKSRDEHTSGFRKSLDMALDKESKQIAIVKRAKSESSMNKVGGIRTSATAMSPTQKLAIGHVMKIHKTKSAGSQFSNKSGRHSHKTTGRVTIMLFTVSIIFVLAFIPHLTLMILTFHSETFLKSLSGPQIMVFQLFLRFFVINNVANPIVYLYCDSRFRDACIDIFFRCKLRRSTSRGVKTINK